ncbi:MAG: hypothetical protein Q9N62_06870 [Ghiorsea sp.]|nr:hypothetical protein [Ghiorsea sp.]
MPKRIEAKLSALAGLIKGVDINSHYPLAVLTLGQIPSDEIMNAASSVVQSIAQFSNGIPLQAHAAKIIGENTQPLVHGLNLPVFKVGMDALVLGTFDDLERALALH